MLVNWTYNDVDREKSLKNHGNVFWNFCGNPVNWTYNDVELLFSQRLQHNKSKKKKRQEYRDRHQENDDDQPAKKKPLLQTPMEERPICRFFKEGKCQKVYQ